jgi:hypothetical protein
MDGSFVLFAIVALALVLFVIVLSPDDTSRRTVVTCPLTGTVASIEARRSSKRRRFRSAQTRRVSETDRRQLGRRRLVPTSDGPVGYCSLWPQPRCTQCCVAGRSA